MTNEQHTRLREALEQFRPTVDGEKYGYYEEAYQTLHEYDDQMFDMLIITKDNDYAELLSFYAWMAELDHSPEVVAYQNALARQKSDPDRMADNQLLRERNLHPSHWSRNSAEEGFRLAEDTILGARSYLGRVRGLYYAAKALEELDESPHGALEPMIKKLRDIQGTSAGTFWMFTVLSLLTLGILLAVFFYPPAKALLAALCASPAVPMVLCAAVVIFLWIYAGFGTALICGLILGFLSWLFSGAAIAAAIVRIAVYVVLFFLLIAFTLFGMSEHLAAVTGVRGRKMQQHKQECLDHISAMTKALALLETEIAAPNEDLAAELGFYFTMGNHLVTNAANSLRSYYDRLASLVKYAE